MDIVERLETQHRDGIMGVPDDWVFLSYGDAAHVIRELREANSALMAERSNLIATKQDQLDALRKDRDEWKELAQQYESVRP